MNPHPGSGEIGEDEAEIAWHAQHLRERLAAARPAADGLAPYGAALRREIAGLAALPAGMPPASLLAAQEPRLRTAYKALAFVETAREWHSAPASLACPVRDLAPLGVKAGINDYQRGYIDWAEGVERHIAGTTLEPAGLAGRSLLFSSGMGALQTALSHCLGVGRRLAVGRRTYYETQDLLSRMGGVRRLGIIPVDEAERDPCRLAEALGHADTLLLDTISLDGEGVRADLPAIWQAAARSGRPFTLILDVTVMGPDLAISRPPPSLTVILAESLLKHRQAGLDLAAAGSLTILEPQAGRAGEELPLTLEKLRALNGTNISAFNARALPLLPRELMLRRSRRQRRNAGLTAERLDTRYLVQNLGHAGLLFVVCPFAADAARLATSLGLARGQHLVAGTSFGLNATRIATSPVGEPCLRIACGQEHEAAARALADTIADALDCADHPAVQAACSDLHVSLAGLPCRGEPPAAATAALDTHLRKLEAAVAGALGRGTRWA